MANLYRPYDSKQDVNVHRDALVSQCGYNKYTKNIISLYIIMHTVAGASLLNNEYFSRFSDDNNALKIPLTCPREHVNLYNCWFLIIQVCEVSLLSSVQRVTVSSCVTVNALQWPTSLSPLRAGTRCCRLAVT